ncbi:MAG: protein kinase, partial [Gemmatimonadaceae bacterium]|nr:protein kinase [Gemmatimonadaceae bacterium]
MPRIDPHQWAELGPLLDRALEVHTEERAAWLARLRHDAPELADAVSELLSADAVADERGFLDTPHALTLAGRELGHYTLERPLGHGGMGSVWLARRTDGRFDGFAAVKLMNLALMSDIGQARFRREGTALSRLTHPAIARLLDAGVADSGQPYLVLEYVDGMRIDTYADSAALTRDQRVDLVLQVLDAVGHAHANLIVHRDLKPSNILVTADGQVKLLDFGIAKLLRADGDEQEGTALTSDGGSALTPDYAAPEQVMGENVTTATDVYALGVLLYLLLSGRHPTKGDTTTPGETVRRVLEVEPTRLGLGDLDLIVMKALKKSPSERYSTVGSFADDLRRYLRHEPVTARPDSLGYRAGKFLRRNRTAVAAATVVGIVLIVATAYSLLQAKRVAEQRDVAVRALRRATAMTELQGVLASDSRGADGELLTQAARIGLAERVLVQRFRGEPWLVAESLTDLAGRLGESLDNEAERAMLARASAIARANDLPEQTALAACTRATSFWLDDQIDSIRSELAIARAALERVKASVDPAVRAICLEADAKALQATGNADSAVVLMQRAVQLVDDEPTSTRKLYTLVALSEMLRFANRHRDAAVAQQRALNELESVGYGDTEILPNMVSFLDRSLADLGEFRMSDSILSTLIRVREARSGAGRVPMLLAFLHGMNKQRLGDVDSADVWIGRATQRPWADGGTQANWLPSVLAQIRVAQGRLSEARAAAERLPDGRPGRRATAALVRALLARATGNAGAGLLIEHELAAIYAESTATQSLFTLPLVTAGEWRLAEGDARAADSLARLGWRAAILDSLAQQRSALAGRADLLSAQARRVL